MRKVIKLTETQLNNIVNRVLKEQQYSPAEKPEWWEGAEGFKSEIRKRKYESPKSATNKLFATIWRDIVPAYMAVMGAKGWYKEYPGIGKGILDVLDIRGLVSGIEGKYGLGGRGDTLIQEALKKIEDVYKEVCHPTGKYGMAINHNQMQKLKQPEIQSSGKGVVWWYCNLLRVVRELHEAAAKSGNIFLTDYLEEEKVDTQLKKKLLNNLKYNLNKFTVEAKTYRDLMMKYMENLPKEAEFGEEEI